MNKREKSNTLAAIEELRGLIFSGELAADSNHLESELATRLGMSRTPVREATLVLAGEGLLEVRPRKGVRICAISAREMSEIYEVLTALECLAARTAALAGHPQSKLASLEGCILKMEQATKIDDRVAWSKADEDFHNALISLGGNAHLQRIVLNFNDRVRRARNLTLHMRPLPTKSNDDHRALYEAILRGDGDTAEAVHRAHRTHTRELLTAILEKHGLKRV